MHWTCAELLRPGANPGFLGGNKAANTPLSHVTQFKRAL